MGHHHIGHVFSLQTSVRHGITGTARNWVTLEWVWSVNHALLSKQQKWFDIEGSKLLREKKKLITRAVCDVKILFQNRYSTRCGHWYGKLNFVGFFSSIKLKNILSDRMNDCWSRQCYRAFSWRFLRRKRNCLSIHYSTSDSEMFISSSIESSK